MKQCRICFGQENPQFMLCPCDCKGTMAYIHVECLEEYFQHYPDRICRVCHQYMYYNTPFDSTMFTLLMIWLSVLILVSNISVYAKMFSLGLLASVFFIKLLRKVLNVYVSIFIFVCTLLIATTPYKHLTNSILLAGCIVVTITMTMYIPMRFILMFFINILIACYCMAAVVFFSEQNDIFITSYFMAIFLFCWAMIIQNRPPVRYL